MLRLALPLLLLLVGCHKEPPFDDRFNQAAAHIEQRAKALDSELAKAENASPNVVSSNPSR